MSPRFADTKVGGVAFRGQASVGLGPTLFLDWTRVSAPAGMEVTMTDRVTALRAELEPIVTSLQPHDLRRHPDRR